MSTTVVPAALAAAQIRAMFAAAVFSRPGQMADRGGLTETSAARIPRQAARRELLAARRIRFTRRLPDPGLSVLAQ
jgi:hypothetical protein